MFIELKKKLSQSALYLGSLVYNNRDSKVLYYHDVHDDNDIPFTKMSTKMSLFSKQIEVIKRCGFDIVEKITKSENQIMLTFDDGYSGIYQNREFFLNADLKPTIFLVSSRIGSPSFLKKEEILNLQNEGFRFESHTHSHPELNVLNSIQLFDELRISKFVLEDLLNKEINEVCFPKGLFNIRVLDASLDAGYRVLYSSIPGKYYTKSKYPLICRNLVQHVSPTTFKSILFGGSYLFRDRYTKLHFKK